jgi:N utilization substance protein B
MPSGPEGQRPRRDRETEERVRSRRAGRRLALAAVFEAEFGQRTAEAVLERHLALEEDGETASLAREIVAIVTVHRDTLDAQITSAAPQYPVVQLARMDRALLRCALGEMLHSPATPAPVAISEWVELARTYSGDPTRRLLNGVLGRIVREQNAIRRDTPT